LVNKIKLKQKRLKSDFSIHFEKKDMGNKKSGK
jgi:hypothetical protein